MKIIGAPQNTVANNILSGYYSQNVNRGIRPQLFELSSPSHPVSEFSRPFDAFRSRVISGYLTVTDAGRKIKTGDAITTHRSGKLYYYDHADLYGVCHGFGRDRLTHYSGANFYNAFYPAGYIVPPFGETLSIFGANQEGYPNLNMGACAQLSITEYNEQMGIVSMGASDVSIETAFIQPSAYSPIYSPRGVCPSDVAVATYYEEVNLLRIPGTTTQLGATTYYNGNPIPTSLDNFKIVFEPTQGRYEVTGDGDERAIPYMGDGRPTPSYSPDDQKNVLNTTLCPASIMETDVAAGKGTNGTQIVEAVDIMQSKPEDQVYVANGLDTAFYYWHWTFRENADSLPFSNYNLFNPQGKEGVYHRGIGEDTELFNPTLSYDEAFWQNRQCPDTVDYLPWTFGASIYACPSYHFDIPYYAATKKFGFYGTRFLNSCSKLDLTNSWNGVDNALELPSGTGSYPLGKTILEPHTDTEGSWSFAMYDNLLRTAATEERYSNMYALNKGFFLWANQEYVTGLPEYNSFTGLHSGIKEAFEEMMGKFTQIFGTGLSGFLSGEPKVIITGGIAGTNMLKESGVVSDILFTNREYQLFRNYVDSLGVGTGIDLWNQVESGYAYYVANSGGSLNESFYSGVISGREKRMRTRYMENTVKGNAIDLYPMNHIPFTVDYAREFLENSGWARKPASFGLSSPLPEVGRRYFEGAYGQTNYLGNLTESLSKLQFLSGTAYYPGFFNNVDVNRERPQPHYEYVLSGDIRDTGNRPFSPSGWFAIGYNGIGALDANFSCFTPIFIQHPPRKLYCKIGQHPTFRSKAVDYHSIPDDKISPRYPEIVYWAYRLKLVDNQIRNLYPMKYKWLRVPKTGYSKFIGSGDFSLAEYASATGEWGCIEGDNCNCTFFHPTGSHPNGVLKNPDNYTFIKGAQYRKDDSYYYMCMASGRFGIRLSEPSELNVENWLRFDVAIKNGTNTSLGTTRVAFTINDVSGKDWTIGFESDPSTPYAGYQRDAYAIPECVVEQKRPPPNAGFGDVWAYRFVGPVFYIGSTRSWSPDTLKDTRGLRESWGRFIEYGNLTPFSRYLSQTEGDLLYGYKHLPTCEAYQMPNGKKGIKVIANMGGYEITHWSLNQQAVAATDSSVGMQWNKMGHIGQLYPPITAPRVQSDKGGSLSWGAAGSDPYIGGNAVGHWQWGNNLGSIKRFGYLSNEDPYDLVFIGRNAVREGPEYLRELAKVKEKFIQPSTLAGENCGYHNGGLGRNMLYYIEAYGRFYHLCDLLKKKNVKNISFMCPGLRHTNSAIQYFWMGQPNNTYLERRPMYGPYAYQWRVKRHNRDRNGNGASEGFYSMGWDARFTLLYDAPAVYGLYVKRKASTSYQTRVREINAIRGELFPGADLATYRNIWFGLRGTEGTSNFYGNQCCTIKDGGPLCDYIDTAISLAETPDFAAYSCPQDRLKEGQCFDPCVSLRYAQGFFPGGKKQNMFNTAESSSSNVHQPKNIRLVAMANFSNASGTAFYGEEPSKVETNTFFRAPIWTPHALVWSGMNPNIHPDHIEQIAGISPCEDGGSDHCNYLTPTLHLNTSSVPVTESIAFNAAGTFSMNLYSQYNIREES